MRWWSGGGRGGSYWGGRHRWNGTVQLLELGNIWKTGGRERERYLLLLSFLFLFLGICLFLFLICFNMSLNILYLCMCFSVLNMCVFCVLASSAAPALFSPQPCLSTVATFCKVWSQSFTRRLSTTSRAPIGVKWQWEAIQNNTYIFSANIQHLKIELWRNFEPNCKAMVNADLILFTLKFLIDWLFLCFCTCCWSVSQLQFRICRQR